MVPAKLTKEERQLFEELAGASKFDPRKHES
jgi:chromosome segregation ATPase